MAAIVQPCRLIVIPRPIPLFSFSDGVVANGSQTALTSSKEWEAEKRENALLREHLNDLAAEVVSLTSALDGENGEIRNMADEVTAGIEPANDKSPQTLAERIRALQSQVARH